MQNQVLEVGFNDRGKLEWIRFRDPIKNTLMRVDRYRDGTKFRYIKSGMETPNLPDQMSDHNPSDWTESQALNYASSLAETANILLVVNNKSVDIHEFKRTVFNAELSSKLPVPELDKIRNMGDEIIHTLDKINNAHFITSDDYKKLQEFNKKNGEKLHL